MLSRRRIDESDGSDSGHGLTLAAVPRNVEIVIDSIRGDDLIAARLLEMGLTPGAKVTVVGAAFSGDPIEVSVRRYRLTLRLAEAARVVVQSQASDG